MLSLLHCDVHDQEILTDNKNAMAVNFWGLWVLAQQGQPILEVIRGMEQAAAVAKAQFALFLGQYV